MRLSLRIVTIATAVVLLLAGCGGGDSGTVIQMGDGFFEPDRLVFEAGEELVLEVENPDTPRQHDLVIVREVFDLEFPAREAVETHP